MNRLYCPSEKVAKRALLDGLEESQIRVFGLPIRPSFVRAVLSKVDAIFSYASHTELSYDNKVSSITCFNKSHAPLSFHKFEYFW